MVINRAVNYKIFIHLQQVLEVIYNVKIYYYGLYY